MAVESRVEQVTVYAVGARVRRVARVAAPLPGRLRLGGLPLALIDDSIRVEVTGAAAANAVRVTVEAPEAPAAGEEPEDVARARERSLAADREVERLEQAIATTLEAPIVADDPSEAPPAPWADVARARQALVAIRTGRERHLRERLAAANREAGEAERALEAIVEREARATTARAARVHELRKVVELELAGQGDIEVRLDYRVAAARWAPSYVARLDGDQAIVEVRAVVAQRTGEDWLGATLRLSTAEPEQFATLPELAPQRIGRRQERGARRGFRPAPTGADALYADYLRAASPAPPPPPAPEPELAGEFEEREDTNVDKKRAITQEVWDEQSSRAKAAFRTPADGAPAFYGATRGGGGGAPASPAPPPQAAFDEPEGTVFAQRLSSNVVGSDVLAVQKPKPQPAPPLPRLDYGNLRMAPPSSPSRGRLVPADGVPYAAAIAAFVGGAVDALALLPLPPGCEAEWAHAYDYAFAADGAVDVTSDGAWHALAITAKPARVELRHVAVPREQADVFRVAAIANPHAAPLLPGPIDVYDRGTFLITSRVDTTAPGAPLEIGLGVDPQVKIARNTEFHEEATGMLRGALRLVHAIAIDVDNRSARAIDLEVRERVPVVRDGDDSVEVAVTRVEPAWERWTPDPDAPADERLRGVHRWRVQLPAGGKRQLRAGYEVKMASKLELAGGNRRES